MSYIMERLPGAQTGGVENFKPLFRLQGAKVEAIYDITKVRAKTSPPFVAACTTVGCLNLG